jgi:tRNA (guanine37-N1)-methyltransferase
MRFEIITIFPEMFQGPFSSGVLGKAIAKGLIKVVVHNLRDFTEDKHQQVDDRPFGGGEGMVLKPEPIFRAVEKVRLTQEAEVVLLTPQGERFTWQMAEELKCSPQVILICGRYEGVDERVAEHLATRELSIGDFILTGGELAAMVVVEAVARLVPGVVGKEEAARKDTFFRKIFDYPQYTRPRDFRGYKVPEVLLSGNHDKINQWRRRRALEKTWRRRPDLINLQELSSEEQKFLDEIKNERKEK